MRSVNGLFVAVMVLLCGSFVFAQDSGLKSVAISGNVAIPYGDFGDFAGIGFGGSATGVFALSPQLALTGTAGYLKFGSKSEDIGGASAEASSSAIPIMAGVRFYPQAGGTGPQFFVGGEAGVHLFSVKVESEITIGGQTSTFEADDSSTEFAFAPMAGVQVGNLDIAAFAAFISDANYFGARVGYAIPVGK